jgi:two-component system chemotaxis response regulator CheY
MEIFMPKTVCIVDDQPSLRQMLRFALNVHGLQVIEAENGLDALDKLASHNIDMMIVDWQMPKMDGLTLVRHLRNSEDYTEIPVVIISCCDDLSARQEARSLGVMNWLKKPFRIAEVQLAVENGLGLSFLSAQHHVEQLGTGRI